MTVLDGTATLPRSSLCALCCPPPFRGGQGSLALLTVGGRLKSGKVARQKKHSMFSLKACRRLGYLGRQLEGRQGSW